MPQLSLQKPVSGNPLIWQDYDAHVETAQEEGKCWKPGGACPRGYYYGGIDYAVGMWTRVNAAAPGFAKCEDQGDQGYGKNVRVDHGHGCITIYAHLSEFKTRDGQYVERGAMVGLSGSTGNSSGPHLHFELRVNAIPIDPEPFFGNGSEIFVTPVVYGGQKTVTKQRMFTRAPSRRKKK